jgi:hypothetical protein
MTLEYGDIGMSGGKAYLPASPSWLCQEEVDGRDGVPC